MLSVKVLCYESEHLASIKQASKRPRANPLSVRSALLLSPAGKP